MVSKERRKLNQKQIALLHLVYRFRFVTTELVALYQDKSSKSVYPRLQALAEQGYIGRRFEPHYRLAHQPAAYFLLPDSVRVLREQPKEGYDYSDKVLHNVRRDPLATDRFIARNLDIFSAYCQLKNRYGDELQFFTKNDLVTYDHFPQPLPDAYLRLKVGDTVKEFFLDVHQQDAPFFMSLRRIKEYADYADSGTWEATETKLPDILALCDTPLMQKRVAKRTVKQSHPDLNFYLATKEAIKDLVEQTSIWQPANEPGVQVSLESV